MKAPADLARTIEVVLTTGLLLSATLLLVGLAAGSPASLHWGILLLMLTPVARVVVLTVGLLHEGDWLFGALSLAILAVLGASMLAGSKLP